MMNMLMPPIPADLPATLQTLQDLVALISNPDATKQRITEMQTATATLQQTIDDQKAQMVAFAVAEADHQQALENASAEASEKIATDQTAFDAECARRKAELDQREAQIAQQQASAQADADAAAAARADYLNRLSLIRQATG